MKTCKNILLLLIVVSFANCNNSGAVIEGSLSSERYDNEWVFWVPFTGPATSKTVDSALIQKNEFRMNVSPHNINKTGIIRVRYQLRLGLQDILVYTEPGTMHVHLDTISRATGTPLNDVLQYWKDRKQSYDLELLTLRRNLRSADADEEKTREEMKNVSTLYHDDIYQIVLQNKDNDVGKFIYSLHKGQFTEEQVNEIDK